MKRNEHSNNLIPPFYRGALVATLFGLLNLNLGCESSSSSNSVVGDGLVNQLAAATCEIDPKSGDALDSTVLRSANLSIQIAAFDKEFDQSQLIAVQSTSASETLRYMLQRDLNVFKYSDAGEGCVVHSEALPMSSGVAAFWKKAVDSSQQEVALATQGVVVGLYVPLKSANIRIAGESKPFIIVREKSTRWTLVHEYMHHLFADRGIATGYSDEAEQGRRAIAGYGLREISEADFSDVSSFERKLPLLVDFFRADEKLNTQYVLEEMTIESLLRKHYELGRLRFVTSFDYDNAGWYLEASASKYLESSRKAKATIEKAILLSANLPNSTPKTEDIISNLRALSRDLESHRQEVKDIVIKNQRREYKMSAVASASAGVLGAPANNNVNSESGSPYQPMGCSHSHEDELVQKIRDNVFEKFDNI